jgi:hypothetical protein
MRVGPLALLSYLLCLLSWQLTAALFLGRWLLGPAGLGPHREWAALALSVVLSGYYVLWGRNHVRRYRRMTRGRREALTWRQALIVAALMTAVGAFGTWLFVQGRA